LSIIDKFRQMAKGIKTEGRAAGAVSKSTAKIREHFQNLVSYNLEQLNEDLKSLEPLQRLRMIIDILKFVVPTLKATELTTDKENGFKPITIKILSSKEIRRIDAEFEAKY
jgi:hypothetical protein